MTTWIGECPQSRDAFEKYDLEKGFWPCGAFLMYSAEALRECVQRFPLTIENVRDTISRSTIRFDDYGSRCWPDLEFMRFTIKIQQGLPSGECAQHLLHEVTHVYYRIHVPGFIPRVREDGSLTDDGVLEGMIDETADIFYERNKELVDEIVRNLK